MIASLLGLRIHILETLGLGALLVAGAGWLAGQIDDHQFRTITLVPPRFDHEATVIDPAVRIVEDAPLDGVAEGWCER